MRVPCAWFRRVIAALVLGALMFAPAPLQFASEHVLQATGVEILAARVLSPTFDEGRLTHGLRWSFEPSDKRTEIGGQYRQAMPVTAVHWVASLLAGTVLMGLHFLRPTHHFRARLGSRAPPSPILS